MYASFTANALKTSRPNNTLTRLKVSSDERVKQDILIAVEIVASPDSKQGESLLEAKSSMIYDITQTGLILNVYHENNVASM